MSKLPHEPREAMSPDGRIARIAERQHSVFTHAQAIACGLSDSQIATRIANGRWSRVHRGVYRLRGAKLTFEGRALAAVLAAGPHAVASFTTAGKLWNIEGVIATVLHVSIPNRTHLVVPGAVIHRPVALPASDRTSIGGIPVTTPQRTVVDLAQVLRRDTLEDALDDLRRRGLVDSRELLDRVKRTPPQGRRGLGVLRRLLEERVGQPPSGSGRENGLFRLLKGAGLPLPVKQHVITTRDGRFVAKVDLAYPEAKVALEFDGYEKHASRKRWENDRRRQNRLVELGWLPLRITSRQVDRTPDDVVSAVRGVLSVAHTDDTPRT